MGNYASVVLADKPIRYYRLSETSGTTALDQLNSASNGTLHAGVTLNQAGLLTADTDPCMLLDGSSGYISLPTSGLPTAAHAFSVEAWINIPSPSGGGTFPAIFFYGTPSGNQAVEVIYRGSTKAFELSSWSTTLVAAGTLAANNTYHVVVTYDGTTAILYTNGQALGSAAYAFGITLGNAYIGSDTGSGDFLNGYIDEVAFYSVALTPAQISNHYRSGSGALNFPVVPLTAATRDGHMTTTTRDGLSLTTKTRG